MNLLHPAPVRLMGNESEGYPQSPPGELENVDFLLLRVQFFSFILVSRMASRVPSGVFRGTYCVF